MARPLHRMKYWLLGDLLLLLLEGRHWLPRLLALLLAKPVVWCWLLLLLQALATALLLKWLLHARVLLWKWALLPRLLQQARLRVLLLQRGPLQ